MEYVGPRVGAELREDGALALLYSAIMILIYVAFRFSARFAPGAVVAVVHDLAITASILVILGEEFDLRILAAMLAILGYSLNDTIIIYDRIRENMELHTTADLEATLNTSVNQTLSRTVLTSVTTLLALLSLFFLGGEVIQPFAKTMLIGVLVGTYSSIFIASPLLLFLEQRYVAAASQDPEGPGREQGGRLAVQDARDAHQGAFRVGVTGTDRASGARSRVGRPCRCPGRETSRAAAREGRRQRRSSLDTCTGPEGPDGLAGLAGLALGGCGLRRGGGPLGLARADALGRHVDRAVQDCPLLDVQARCAKVALDDPCGLDLDPLGGGEVADHLTDHDDRLGLDLGPQAAVGSDRELMVLKVDGAVHLALDFEVLVARELTLENDRLTNRGHALVPLFACAGAGLRAGRGVDYRRGSRLCIRRRLASCRDGLGGLGSLRIVSGRACARSRLLVAIGIGRVLSPRFPELRLTQTLGPPGRPGGGGRA